MYWDNEVYTSGGKEQTIIGRCQHRLRRGLGGVLHYIPPQYTTFLDWSSAGSWCSVSAMVNIILIKA